MPTYDYFCSGCGEKLEAFQKITQAALTTCPKCQKEALVRKPSGGSLSITGDGFYSTMYPNPNKQNSLENSGGCCPCGKNKSACNSPPPKS